MIPTGPDAELTQGLRSSSMHTILIDQKDVTKNDDNDNNEPSEDVSCTANRVYLPFTDIIWNVFCLDRGLLVGILTYQGTNKTLEQSPLYLRFWHQDKYHTIADIPKHKQPCHSNLFLF